MQIGGYMGKVLYVNLTTGESRSEDIDPNTMRKYVGAFGISARLAYDVIKPGTDALSPENPIIIGAGPLVGTSCTSSSRFCVWTRYPLSNTIGPAGGSMSFGCYLKYAGYDELVITGRSEKPVYLKISNEGAEICDAGDLWGKDTHDTTDTLWRRHGPDHGVICSGPAGEHLVKISIGVVDKSATVGRNGFPAVMGSKNLKAIIAGGGKSKIRIYDWVKFQWWTKQVMTDAMSWPERDNWIKLGHLVHTFKAHSATGREEGYFDRMVTTESIRERFSPEAYLAYMKKARIGCPTCAMGCKHINQMGQGKGSMTFQSHPDYFTGIFLGLQSLDEVLELDSITQRNGIDRVAFAHHAAFILDLNERGIIPQNDLEGFELGNVKSILELVQKVTYRQGLGDTLADGLEGIVNRYGKECEKFANCSKRGGTFFFDPRMGTGMEGVMLGVATAPYVSGGIKGGGLSPSRMGCTDPETFRKYGEWMAIPAKTLDRVFDTPFKINTARFSKHSEDLYTTHENLGICINVPIHQLFGMERLAGLYSSATGIEMDAYEIKRAADRDWDLLKALNVREGLSRKDDIFPAKWLKPLRKQNDDLLMKDIRKTKVLTQEDLEKILDDYYDEREWDIKTGIPTSHKLEEIGLSDVADDLAERGIIPVRHSKGWRIGSWGFGDAE